MCSHVWIPQPRIKPFFSPLNSDARLLRSHISVRAVAVTDLSQEQLSVFIVLDFFFDFFFFLKAPLDLWLLLCHSKKRFSAGVSTVLLLQLV